MSFPEFFCNVLLPEIGIESDPSSSKYLGHLPGYSLGILSEINTRHPKYLSTVMVSYYIYPTVYSPYIHLPCASNHTEQQTHACSTHNTNFIFTQIEHTNDSHITK